MIRVGFGGMLYCIYIKAGRTFWNLLCLLHKFEGSVKWSLD